MNKLAVISLILLILASFLPWFVAEGSTPNSNGYVKLTLNPFTMLWWSTHASPKSSLSRFYSMVDWLSEQGYFPTTSRAKIGLSRTSFLLAALLHFTGLLLIVWGGIIGSKVRLGSALGCVAASLIFFVMGTLVMDLPLRMERIINMSSSLPIWIRWHLEYGIWTEIVAFIVCLVALMIQILEESKRRHPIYRVIEGRF